MASGAYGVRAYTQSARPGGLLWTEYLYLIAIAVAAFIAVDPLRMNLSARPDIKHLALVLTLPAVALSLSGRLLSRPGRVPIVPRVLRLAWPFALLALFILAGSSYARWIEGLQNTFLTVGLSMSILFCAAAMTLASRAPEALLRAYFRVLLVAGLAMSAYLIFYFRVRQVYHNEIFLVIPLAVYCALAVKNTVLRAMGAVFFLAMAVLSAKNTSYLIALLVLLYLGYACWIPRLKRADPLNQIAGYYSMFVVLLLMAAVVFFLWSYREAYLPTGNVEYRSHAYTLAWQRFLESPIWGTLFSQQAVQKFTLYDIGIARNLLPTHSDIMDLLAHGGVIGLGLWLLGLFLIGRAAYRTLLAPRAFGHPWAAYAHALAALTFAGIITYSVNPILGHPGLAYLLWTNLGLLLGLALRVAGPPDQSLGNPANWRAGR